MSTVIDLHGRNLLTLSDYSRDELLYLLDLAAQIERCAMGAAGAEERAVTAVRRLAALAGPETSV